MLGEFELLVLLAVLRLGDEAYGASILEEIARRTRRPVGRGSVYITLERLEAKGLLASERGRPDADPRRAREEVFPAQTAGTARSEADARRPRSPPGRARAAPRGSMKRRPPRLALAILNRALPAPVREEIAGTCSRNIERYGRSRLWIFRRRSPSPGHTGSGGHERSGALFDDRVRGSLAPAQAGVRDRRRHGSRPRHRRRTRR